MDAKLQVTEIKINEITIGVRSRSLNPGRVESLADSINTFGLQSPISVAKMSSGYALIAGNHRLQAFKHLERDVIPAFVKVDLDELDRELLELLENFEREDLPALEHGKHLKRFKEIYEIKFPQTKQGQYGYKGGKVVEMADSAVSSFSETASEKTGQSQRVIRENIQIATDIAQSVQEKIMGTESANDKTGLLLLAQLKDEAEQDKLAEKVISGEAENITMAVIQRAEELDLKSPEYLNEAQQKIKGKAKKLLKKKEEIAARKSSPHVSQNSGNNEWYTPVEFIEAARKVMDNIDLDPASSAIANKTVQAARYFTANDDGLSQKWTGKVWLNPPYASDLVARFCDKLVESVQQNDVSEAIILVNNATETAWFSALISAATAIVFPKSRIKFLDSTGIPNNTPLQGQAFLYFGKTPAKFLDVFKTFGWGAIPQ